MAVFEPPWALGNLKHLCKEPDVYIYPLAMAPAQKKPLILNCFCFYLFFLYGFSMIDFHLVGPILDPCWGQKFFKVGPFHAWSLVLSSYCEISPKTELSYQFFGVLLIFFPLVVVFAHFALLGANKATLNALTTLWGPHGDPRRCWTPSDIPTTAAEFWHPPKICIC